MKLVRMVTKWKEMDVPVAKLRMDMCAKAQGKTVVTRFVEMASWLDLSSVTTGIEEHVSLTAWDLRKRKLTTDLQK